MIGIATQSEKCTKEKRIKILQEKEGEKMALSGSFEGSVQSGHYKIRVDWSATQNVANNTSTITAKLYFIHDWSLNIAARSNAHSVTIDGTATTFSSSAINSSSSTTLIGTATKTVNHNADGTRTVALSAVFALKATLSGTYYGNISASATITLDTIARASQPSLSAGTTAMGSAVTIYTNRASSSFAHTLTYSFGSASGTIGNAGESISWTIPLSLASQIPSATSGTGTITCYTYNGSTLIGTKTVNFTATVPSSVVPSISSIACSDPYGYATTYGGYVQNKSKVMVAVTAAGSYGSTITSYRIVANGSTYTANNCTTEVLTGSGTNRITVYVTDSRGRTASSSTTITVLVYRSPNISQFSVVRCLSDGTEDADGAYMKVTVGAAIGSLNSKNTKLFELKYKQSTVSSWTPGKTWATEYSVHESVILEANIDYSYNVQLVATDAFGTVTAEVEPS